MRKMLFITFNVGRENLAERILNAQIKKICFEIVRISTDTQTVIPALIEQERPRYIIFDGMLPPETVFPVYEQIINTIAALDLDTELHLFDQDHKELPGARYISFSKLKTLVPQLEYAS